MRKQVMDEIEEFLRQKAPGLTLTRKDNPAFNSTTLTMSLSIEQTRLIGDHVEDKAFGAKIIEMLTDIQKAAVTAIGLEEYVRSRQQEVLTMLQERVEAGLSAHEALDQTEQSLG